MGALEILTHPFYVGVQFHPEYLSRPMRPSPTYLGLLLAASGKLKAHLENPDLLLMGKPTSMFS